MPDASPVAVAALRFAGQVEKARMMSVLQRAAGELPVEVTSFVGRRHELAEVRRSLRGTRLLTLTGAGGVGKTRLALRAASGFGRAFPDGIWLVELAELKAPELLADRVASSLGLDSDPKVQAWARLNSFVAGKRLLLMLDNCEHLRDACALLAGRLLAASDGLHILATSRQPLDVRGERTLIVPPLAVPDQSSSLKPAMLGQYDGVALFVDRAGAIVPGFEVTAQNCELVVRLCQQLDGIPLAIELAAARLRAFSLPQIIKLVADRFALLTTGNRSGPSRQQTLRALIDWSFDLCSIAERTIWSRLSVFAGGFDLAAAEAVCASDDLDPSLVEELLAALVDKSVLIRTERNSRTRFRMLETIREYGQDRLSDSSELSTIGRRHRDWCRRLVGDAEAGWVGPEQVAWYERIRLESANLQVALDFCVDEGEGQVALDLAASLCAHRRACGSLSEGRRWLDHVLGRAPGPCSERARALWVNAWLALLQGDTATARALLRECEQVADQIDDPVALAYAVQFTGMADMFDGDFPSAIATLEKAVELHREHHTSDSSKMASMQLIMVRCFAGDPGAAGALRQARAFAKPGAGSPTHAYLSWYEAIARFVRGDRRGAVEPTSRALRIGTDTGDRWLVALCLETLAWTAAAEGEYSRGARLLGAAEMMRREIGSQLGGLVHLHRPHDECERSARAALGDDLFETAHRSGEGLTEDQAVSYALGSKAVAKKARAAATDKTPLTRREREIAELVGKGMSNREIAARLVIAQRTAETHVGHILTKLGFTTRAQIAAWAAEHRAASTM